MSTKIGSYLPNVMSGNIDACSFWDIPLRIRTKDTRKGDFSFSEFFKGEGDYWTFIIWPCLKRTGNNQIQELDSGLDFPI